MSELLCDQCGGDAFELIGCCSGRECGCMGQPVDAKPCSKCNPDGKKEPSSQAKRDYPWFFLTEEEWGRHLAEEKARQALDLDKPMREMVPMTYEGDSHES